MKRWILIAASLLLAAPPLLAQPAVTFDGDTVTAKGITPGGSAVFLGAGHQRGDWLDHVVHFQAVANDDDLDGVVTFTRKKGMPLQAVAIVVDVASGEIGFGSPADFPHPGPRPLPAAALESAPGAVLNRIAETASRLEVLLVKKGEGAWATSLFDGGPLDADTVEDGAVTVALDALSPVGATAHGSDGARAGDVLVLLDPMTLEYAAARVPARKN